MGQLREMNVFVPNTDFVFSTAVSEPEMPRLGDCLAQALIEARGGLVYLDGTLGMGKTALSRSVIQACGWHGRVRSPTYTLLEPYECEHLTLAHFDLYRLGDPEELEFLGIRDYLESDIAWLVEWPERGTGVLPEPDLVVHFREAGTARELGFEACSDRGRTIRDRLRQLWERA